MNQQVTLLCSAKQNVDGGRETGNVEWEGGVGSAETDRQTDRQTEMAWQKEDLEVALVFHLEIFGNVSTFVGLLPRQRQKHVRDIKKGMVDRRRNFLQRMTPARLSHCGVCVCTLPPHLGYFHFLCVCGKLALEDEKENGLAGCRRVKPFTWSHVASSLPPSLPISLNLREKGHHNCRPHFLHCLPRLILCGISQATFYLPGNIPSVIEKPCSEG